MRVAIVDDEPLARALTASLLGECDDVDVIGEASDATAGLALVRAARPDAVFLDVSMPGRSGVQAALDLIPHGTDVVFLTAHEEYAVDAFELGATDYLLKPLRRLRLAKALDRLRQRSAARHASGDPAVGAPAPPVAAPADAFWVATLHGVARVDVASINRVEAARDHVYFHTAERAYLHRATMASLEDRLASAGLIRVHRSAFVRPSGIVGVDRHGKVVTLTLADGSHVPVGPMFRSATLAAVSTA